MPPLFPVLLKLFKTRVPKYIFLSQLQAYPSKGVCVLCSLWGAVRRTEGEYSISLNHLKF